MAAAFEAAGGAPPRRAHRRRPRRGGGPRRRHPGPAVGSPPRPATRGHRGPARRPRGRRPGRRGPGAAVPLRRIVRLELGHDEGAAAARAVEAGDLDARGIAPPTPPPSSRRGTPRCCSGTRWHWRERGMRRTAAPDLGGAGRAPGDRAVGRAARPDGRRGARRRAGAPRARRRLSRIPTQPPGQSLRWGDAASSHRRPRARARGRGRPRRRGRPGVDRHRGRWAARARPCGRVGHHGHDHGGPPPGPGVAARRPAPRVRRPPRPARGRHAGGHGGDARDRGGGSPVPRDEQRRGGCRTAPCGSPTAAPSTKWTTGGTTSSPTPAAAGCCVARRTARSRPSWAGSPTPTASP